MRSLIRFLLFAFCFLPLASRSASILIPMDETQKDHLKSYGIAFWILKHDEEVDWLLNYRGGSFMAKYEKQIEEECKIRGVSYEVITDAKVNEITLEITDPSVNMNLIKLEKAPKVAVYSPREGLRPSDDAVILVLRYAEIPFEIIYDEEILKDALLKYDWVHLHHEDFTGEYSKNYRRGKNQPEFMEDKNLQETTARRMGFQKVSKMKLAVAQRIREFLRRRWFSVCYVFGSRQL